MRVKFSQRHDIPGCINHQELQVNFTKDHFHLSCFCDEGDLRIKYVLDFDTWGTIKPKKSFWKEESVGGILVTMVKNPSPARWQTLTLDH